MGEATRILAIRHGQTAWNADGRIQGHQDIGLDDTGRRQALALARALRDETLQAVYSSDLLRATQTAQPLQQLQALPALTDAGLRERCFGSFEGFSFAQIAQQSPEAAERWRQREPGFSPGGGESLLVFRERVESTVERLALQHRGGCIALVTHGGVLDILYRQATHLGLSAPRHWAMANASINRLLQSDQGLALVGWADTAHLEALRDDLPQRPAAAPLSGEPRSRSSSPD